MTTERQRSITEQTGITEALTKENMRTLVNFCNSKNGHESKTEEERKQIVKEHEELRKFCVEKYGEGSVANLLPTNSLDFRPVIHKLELSGVHTKKDLIGIWPREIKYVSSIESALISLMRGLGQAQSRAQASK